MLIASTVCWYLMSVFTKTSQKRLGVLYTKVYKKMLYTNYLLQTNQSKYLGTFSTSHLINNDLATPTRNSVNPSVHTWIYFMSQAD